MKIIGHQNQRNFLKRMADNNEFPHAFIFSGAEKLGKKTIAQDWIYSFFGQSVGNIQHPDLTLIKPREKEIEIEQIREMIWKLSLKPYSAPLKAVIIDQAHSMNQESQTALLKTLEEPRGKTVIILVTEFPESLLPTIVSRSQKIKFYPVEKEEIKNFIKEKGIAKEELEKITALSFGRPGRVIDFISNPEKFKSCVQKIEEIEKLSKSDLSARFKIVELLIQNTEEDIKDNLNIWLTYFRNILLEKIEGKTVQYSLDKLKKIIKLIQRIQFITSTTNVNSRLALEVLMMRI